MQRRGRTIGKLAEEAGVHVETIRYYERRGILKQPSRPENGWRTYGDDALATLRFVKRAQRLGFRLDEIEQLLQLREDENSSTCSRSRGLAGAKLEEISQKLEELEAIRDVLQTMLVETPQVGGASACAVIGRLERDFEEAVLARQSAG